MSEAGWVPRRTGRRFDHLPIGDEPEDSPRVAVRFASADLLADGWRSSPATNGHFVFAPLLPERSRFSYCGYERPLC